MVKSNKRVMLPATFLGIILAISCSNAYATLQEERSTSEGLNSVYQLVLDKEGSKLYASDVDMAQSPKVVILDSTSLKPISSIKIKPIRDDFFGRQISAINQVYSLSSTRNQNASDMVLLGEARSNMLSLIKKGKLVAENVLYQGSDEQLKKLSKNRHTIIDQQGKYAYVVSSEGRIGFALLRVDLEKLAENNYEPTIVKDATTGWGVTMDNSGNIWTSGTDIRRISTNGDVKIFKVVNQKNPNPYPSMISLAVDGKNQKIIVLNNIGAQGAVMIYRIKGNNLVQEVSIPTGQHPLEVFVDEDEHKAFVSLRSDRSILEIDTQRNAVTDLYAYPYDAKGYPNSLYVDSRKHHVYASFLEGGVKRFSYGQNAVYVKPSTDIIIPDSVLKPSAESNMTLMGAKQQLENIHIYLAYMNNLSQRAKLHNDRTTVEQLKSSHAKVQTAFDKQQAVVNKLNAELKSIVDKVNKNADEAFAKAEAKKNAVSVAEAGVRDAEKLNGAPIWFQLDNATDKIRQAKTLPYTDGPCEASITAGDNMRYNTDKIYVNKSCGIFTIHMYNTGVRPKAMMMHNIVVTKKADAEEVSNAARQAGVANDFMPKDRSKILAFTGMTGPGDLVSVTLDMSKFDPSQQYTFFCSAYAHFNTMQGSLIVR